MFLPIMEHDPSGDQITIKSHQLLLKAGLIHQVNKKIPNSKVFLRNVHLTTFGK
jgi:prolyl-tRNA synthetase